MSSQWYREAYGALPSMKLCACSHPIEVATSIDGMWQYRWWAAIEISGLKLF